MPYDSNTNECLDCGSTVHGKNRGQHSNFHANFIHRSEVKDGFAVSAVKWCDPGDHAFKANIPGSQSFTGQERDENGSVTEVSMDMCPRHAFGMNPEQARLIEIQSTMHEGK